MIKCVSSLKRQERPETRFTEVVNPWLLLWDVQIHDMGRDKGDLCFQSLPEVVVDLFERQQNFRDLETRVTLETVCLLRH
jgi:hypothetical protein